MNLFDRRLRDTADPPGGGGGDPPPGNTPPANTPPADPAPAAGGKWFDALPEDLRSHKYVQQHPDMASLVKDAVNAQALIGRKGAILPQDGAKPEEWSAFYESLGRPKAPTDYTFAMPEGYQASDADKGFQGALAPVLHEAGLTQRQVDTITRGWNAYTQQAQQAAATAAAADRSALEQEWGKDFGANVDLATRAVKQFAGDKAGELMTLQLANGKFLLDDAGMARLFHQVGKMIAEDGGTPAAARAHGDPFASPQAAEAEIKKVNAEALADPKHALVNKAHPDHETVNERLGKLHQVVAEDKLRRGAQ